MPKLARYQLHFHSGLHLSTDGLTLEENGVHIPSDTLFGALVSQWQRNGGDVDAFMQPFVSQPAQPPFLLTSAFPFAGDVHFFPAPVNLGDFLSSSAVQNGKELKRIRYLSESLLKKLSDGNSLVNDLNTIAENGEPPQGVALQEGVLRLSKAEMDTLPNWGIYPQRRIQALHHHKLWDATRTPRVTIDRVNNASTIFHAGRTTFAEESGLWFGVQWLEPEATIGTSGTRYRDVFNSLLTQLGESGIGGERSTGYGAFIAKPMSDELSLKDVAPGQHCLLLSRYHPQASELPETLRRDKTAYTLVQVGGWIDTRNGPAQRRKSLRLVSEGSIVCPTGLPFGDVVDVRPTYNNSDGDLSHPVYRYGLALGVGLSDLVNQ